MDKATATKYHFAVGDRVLMNPARPGTDVHDHRDRHVRQRRQPRRRDARRLRPADRADDLQLPRSLRHDQRPRRARRRQRQPRSARSPSSSRPASRSSAARPSPTSCRAPSTTRSSFISTALLIFAAIALFVGGVHDLQHVLDHGRSADARARAAARRRREPRQLFRSVLGEAAVTGLVASLIGLGLGVLAALGLEGAAQGVRHRAARRRRWCSRRAPSVVAIAVGVGVTVISAIVPARRAVRIAPVAALVEHGGDGRPRSSRRRRVIAGIAVAAARQWSPWWRGWPSRRSRWSASARCWCSSRSRMLVPAVARPLSGAPRTPAGLRCSARRDSWGARTRCATRAGPHRPPPR